MGGKYEALFTELARPFEDWEVKERSSKDGTLHYVDKDTVANRLDEVLGPENWSDGTVYCADCCICTLTVTLPGGEVITRSAVGAYIHTSSDAKLKDPGNLAAYRAKSSDSDAFKRAASRLGVGRYLGKSGVPAFARHAFEPAPAPAPDPQGPAPDRGRDRRADPPAASPSPQARPDRTQSDAPHPSPADVPRTARALYGWAKEQGGRREYDLATYLGEWGRLNGHPKRIVDWSANQVELGLAECERKLATIDAQGRVPAMAGGRA